MPRRLHYFAQAFWDGHPQRCPVYEFPCALDAEEGGRILMTQADGALVYQQWMDEDAGLRDEPEVLLVLGEVPSEAVTIDGDGRDPWLDDVA